MFKMLTNVSNLTNVNKLTNTKNFQQILTNVKKGNKC